METDLPMAMTRVAYTLRVSPSACAPGCVSPLPDALGIFARQTEPTELQPVISNESQSLNWTHNLR